MTDRSISAYRAELRRAAVNTIRSHRRRRRLTVIITIAAGAFLVAGGAIAAQRSWLADSPTDGIRIRGTRAHVSQLSKAFASCMAAHDAHPIRDPHGGFVFRNAASAASACGSTVGSIRITCTATRRPRSHSPGLGDCVITTEEMTGPKKVKTP